MHTLANFARIGAGSADPGDAPALEDDLLVLEPGTRMDVEQAAEGWSFAKLALAQAALAEAAA